MQMLFVESNFRNCPLYSHPLLISMRVFLDILFFKAKFGECILIVAMKNLANLGLITTLENLVSLKKMKNVCGLPPSFGKTACVSQTELPAPQVYRIWVHNTCVPQVNFSFSMQIYQLHFYSVFVLWVTLKISQTG